MAVHLQPVQTKRQIRAVLEAAGIHPRKRLGQHFLIDGNLMRRLAESAGLDRGQVVLEVGAGTGGLTDLLAERARHVVAVEIDRRLFTLLEDRFRQHPAVTLIHGDVLEKKHRIAAEVIGALDAARGAAAPSLAERGADVVLAANLPYQVATPLVMNLLVEYPAVRRLCFTVQREVGDRLTATPNTKDFGPLSILAQLLCRVSVLGRIPPEAFWPQPAVHSVMLRLEVLENPFSDQDAPRRFASFVRNVFEHRRKTLRGALGYAVEPAWRDRICGQFGEQRRPETLSVPEWVAMYEMLHDGGAGAPPGGASLSSGGRRAEAG